MSDLLRVRWLGVAVNGCTTTPSTAAGYGMQCSSLVTGGTCIQTCSSGYTPAGSGAYTCVAGTLGGGSLTCTAVACPANSAGANVGTGCTCATGYTGLRRVYRYCVYSFCDWLQWNLLTRSLYDLFVYLLRLNIFQMYPTMWSMFASVDKARIPSLQQPANLAKQQSVFRHDHRNHDHALLFWIMHRCASRCAFSLRLPS
jgi:hypothetical protein